MIKIENSDNQFKRAIGISKELFELLCEVLIFVLKEKQKKKEENEIAKKVVKNKINS